LIWNVLARRAAYPEVEIMAGRHERRVFLKSAASLPLVSAATRLVGSDGAAPNTGYYFPGYPEPPDEVREALS
jgi:hypothetical protein